MPSIEIEKVWSDDDVVELAITTTDECSSFYVKVYVGRQKLTSLIVDMERFKDKLYGGIYDMKLGEFGHEYANGAFQARLHFQRDGRGHLFITVRVESEWHPFNDTNVASCATLYLKSEPALLDRFIAELGRVSSGTQTNATLECV